MRERTWIDIASLLEDELRKHPSVATWLQSTALAVFSDAKVGILVNSEKYVLVRPQVLLVASGAREKSLAFKGNTLPGVYGAGAFQTLVNRDLVKPSHNLFIVGGGNVGLIAGYHALQAGINVVGVVEALPECGGYKVHKDKLARMGVPIFTSHTIVSANGKQQVESVTIAQVDASFKVIPGTQRTFACDTILIAVGLDPVNEFYLKAIEYGLPAFAAGDAQEIAEASAAMFSGKIKGLEIARHLGYDVGIIPDEWYRTFDILKSKPGTVTGEIIPEATKGVMPIIHCSQEIPCDPCSTVCPRQLITIDKSDIRRLPQYSYESDLCAGCERCVTFCPGLAITLVDFRKEPDSPTVSIPYEFSRDNLSVGQVVTVVDTQGLPLGDLPVQKILSIKNNDRTAVVLVKAPRTIAKLIAGIEFRKHWRWRNLTHISRISRMTPSYAGASGCQPTKSDH